MKLPRLSRPAVLACVSVLALAASVPRLGPAPHPDRPQRQSHLPARTAPAPVGRRPFDYATLGGQNIRVDVLTKALDMPYAIAFLPDGTMLVTERPGRIRVVRNGRPRSRPRVGRPGRLLRRPTGRGATLHGYMNIALHPKFAQTTGSISATPSRWAT